MSLSLKRSMAGSQSGSPPPTSGFEMRFLQSVAVAEEFSRCLKFLRICLRFPRNPLKTHSPSFLVIFPNKKQTFKPSCNSHRNFSAATETRTALGRTSRSSPPRRRPCTTPQPPPCAGSWRRRPVGGTRWPRRRGRRRRGRPRCWRPPTHATCCVALLLVHHPTIHYI